MKNLLNFFAITFVFTQLSASEVDRNRKDVVQSEMSFYDPFVENLSVKDYLSKLKVGELIGKEVPNGKSSFNLKEKEGDHNFKPDKFLTWAFGEAQENSTQLKKTKNLFENLISRDDPLNLGQGLTLSKTNSDNESEVSFSSFRLCSLKVLPLLKHLIAALDSKNDKLVNNYIKKISEVSGQLPTQIKIGDLICSNFLGALRLRIDKDNIVSQFIEESVILSVLIRSQTPYSLVNQNAFLTLWSAYINKDNCSLWSSYWHYLSLEVLIKKNNFPDSVADFSKRYSPDSWSLCGSSAQRDFESWIKSKGLVLK